ncbi:MAG: hypothetical protein ACFBZ8_11275 [Opitutales bacterium]
MKIIAVILSMVLGGAAFLLSSCNKKAPMILESDDVQDFRVVEEASSNSRYLSISGLAFHSSLAVSNMTTETTGKDLNIKIMLSPAKEGLSGRFSYRIILPRGIERVTFGEDGTLIWP